MIGLEDFNQRAHHALGRVVLPGQLALLLGKLCEAVFIGTLGDGLFAAVLDHLNDGKEIDNIP